MSAFDVLCEDRVAAVLRAPAIEDPVALANAFAHGGIRCVEFTFTIPRVLDVIKRGSTSDAVIGAGTVLTREQAAAAIDAGAKFIVSPACRPELVEVCRSAGVPVFLGALTPTEVAEAHEAGATAVKIFPAGVGGPSYIKDLAGPYPQVALIPSGGVSEDNAGEYFAVGCPAVYAGSRLAPPKIVAAGDHDEIERRARRFVQALP
ncbi:MAG: bifunctional 4-hydroxy-2-oxoglutarate aldolase/2-dehydro-3-deoxy-phosphogluconate aldolase [Actinomycetota bacterium]